MTEFALLTATASIIVSVVGVGIALGILGLRAVARLDRRIDRIEQGQAELRERMAILETELRERMATLEAELRERMAKVEGLLEGLREAITARRVA